MPGALERALAEWAAMGSHLDALADRLAGAFDAAAVGACKKPGRRSQVGIA